jgi:predicted metal-dependent hydrolase
MASKEFVLENGMAITVYKRRGSRNLRLSITPHGKVRVTMPAWAPYKTGLDFAKARQSWIAGQQKPARLLANGQTIGKAHHLHFMPQAVDKVSTRLSNTEVIIRHPAVLQPDNPKVQKAAAEASIRALRRQAESLLPQRLDSLALENSFTYNKVGIKRLRGRWGSCDQHANIVLNLFLMQLPWELIDYVLLHELVHTRVLRHGPDFWAEMANVLPNVKALRKQLKEYSPIMA